MNNPLHNAAEHTSTPRCPRPGPPSPRCNAPGPRGADSASGPTSLAESTTPAENTMAALTGTSDRQYRRAGDFSVSSPLTSDAAKTPHGPAAETGSPPQPETPPLPGLPPNSTPTHPPNPLHHLNAPVNEPSTGRQSAPDNTTTPQAQTTVTTPPHPLTGYRGHGRDLTLDDLPTTPACVSLAAPSSTCSTTIVIHG